MSATVQHWLSMSRDELDSLYRRGSPGEIPQGDTRGTPIVAGTPLAKAFASFARLFAWQGKVFDMFAEDGSAGVLVNKVSPFGLGFIVAKVYRAPSWMDGEPTIVIDYSRTSFFFRAVRDEIREIEPGVYLGKVWLGKRRILDFALELPTGD
ncbi:hypothetical protein [Halomonas nitroreducens]|uniref:Uncharacterized protein n=1 Tax=Halomonas nitroreducens TaxID=447425 RepID=A0A3S0JW02_9GAMM|nr:hypothetical protein [Halomonas nitroreducens]RTR00461.1 hypothetical protein EKG36_15750 [Halomonas nitroreducens]